MGRRKAEQKKMKRALSHTRTYTHAHTWILILSHVLFYYRMTASLKNVCTCMYVSSVCVCVYVLASPKFEREKKKAFGQRHNLWNTNTHTRTHTRAILTKRFRWVGFFVKFVRSRRRRRRRESLSALALCVCLRHLQLHSEQSWPRFWCRKLFRSSSLLPSVQSALHKSNGIFFPLPCALLASRICFTSFPHTHTH